MHDEITLEWIKGCECKATSRMRKQEIGPVTIREPIGDSSRFVVRLRMLEGPVCSICDEPWIGQVALPDGRRIRI